MDKKALDKFISDSIKDRLPTVDPKDIDRALKKCSKSKRRYPQINIKERIKGNQGN